jgi:hypothetical protein
VSRLKRKRRSSGGQFIQLFHFMLSTQAWGALTPAERVVYLEVARLYLGNNNGYLALSTRDAATRCNINKDTAARCLRRLRELGFIELAQAGAFTFKIRHAAEWRLTQHPCDRTGRPATRDFQNWRPDPESEPSISDDRSPSVGQNGQRDASSVPSDRTVRTA